MQPSTRMKKYDSLRQSMLEESKEIVETPKLSRFAKRLNTIDSAYFQPMVEDLTMEHPQKRELDDVVVLPSRAKKNDTQELKFNENDSYFNEQEILARALRLSSPDKDVSDDDMLNQFLKEIRSYNMKQGVRSQEDTKLEILKQVRMDHEQESVKPKKKEQDSDSFHRLNIAKQVKELISSNRDNDYESMKTQELHLQTKNESYVESLNQERAHRAKLLEETQQLRVQLSEHEEDLDEIGTGIDYTRKLLNLLVALCLVAVVIAGAILGYLILKG